MSPSTWHILLGAFALLASCERRACTSDKPAKAHRACQPPCSGSACNGCDPKDQRCDTGILNGAFGVERWPDPNLGPNRVDATIHKTLTCGGVKWAYATTNYVCDTFSTWLADDSGNELPNTRYDSRTDTIQIYGDMWSGAARACASVCGHSICSPLDRD